MIRLFIKYLFLISIFYLSTNKVNAQDKDGSTVHIIDGLEYNFDSIVNMTDTSNKFYLNLLSKYKAEEDCNLNDVEREYCVSFDASFSVDSLNPNMEFVWRFDRTVVKEGAITKHCFKKPGYHRVNLKMKDPVTNESGVDQDTTFKFYVAPELSFFMSGDTSIMSTLTFDAGIYARKFPDRTYVWDFGHDYILSGEYIRYVYRDAGQQRATLWVFENVQTDPQLKGCIYKDFKVDINIE